MLSKEQILAAQDLPRQQVEVPEWGGTVLVQGMTAIDRDEWEIATIRIDGQKIVPETKNLRAHLVARCLITEAGERIFSGTDVEALGKKSAAALDRVFAVAQKLSGIGAKDLEELEKN